MRTLMVTPYPPVRDGIAAYAVQEVAHLRRSGHDVEVLSPGPSAAHHHLDLASRRGPLALAKRLGSYDKVIVQFHPDVFYPVPCTTARHVETSLALAAAFRLAGDVEVRVHEVDYSMPSRSPRVRAMAAMWRQVERIGVHTEVERGLFARTFGVDAAKVAVTDHGSSFVARTKIDQAGARHRLGLPDGDFIFLAIGFIQPHKGFDRAIRAYASVASPGILLEVVGSVRVEEPEYLDHVDELRRLANATPGVRLREGFVSDELFDVWLVAADAVVLPYRHIWSSGVIERAAMFERTVIASRVGGLEHQARPGTVLVGDDDELATAMRRAIGTRAVPAPVEVRWPAPGASRADVMTVVRERASASRADRGGGEGGFPVVPARPGSGTGISSLRRLTPLGLPAPSGTSGRRLAKRLTRRLTAWQIDPIVSQMNRLHIATTQAVEDLSGEPGAETPTGDPPVPSV